MPTWIIKGVDRQTTETVVRSVDASNVAEAKSKAEAAGVVPLDVSLAPRGAVVATDGSVDPDRIRVATGIRSVCNAIRWIGAAGCLASVFMLRTPYLFGSLRPPMMVSLAVLVVSLGLVFLGNKLVGD